LIHYITTFLVANSLAFFVEWRIALLTLAIFPPIGLVAATYGFTITSLYAKVASADSEATSVAEQVRFALNQVIGLGLYELRFIILPTLLFHLLEVPLIPDCNLNCQSAGNGAILIMVLKDLQSTNFRENKLAF
jgi:hypothetical protein